MIRRLGLLGVGLVGGSLALALKRSGEVGEVVGYEKKPSHQVQAMALGIVDRIEYRLAAALKGADVVVVAVPLGAMKPLFHEIAANLKPDGIVTDVGSVKGSVVKMAREELGTRITDFVPVHPLAGKEKSGPEAACADLFCGHKVILTPLPDNRPEAVATVKTMWRHTGAEVIETEIAYHDRVLAGTSHLPHVLAYILLDLLGKFGEAQDILKLTAGGFRDFSRIASSDPLLWRDICLANRESLLVLLEQFGGELQQVIEAIRNHDGEQLVEIFTRAKAIRDTYYRT